MCIQSHTRVNTGVCLAYNFVLLGIRQFHNYSYNQELKPRDECRISALHQWAEVFLRSFFISVQHHTGRGSYYQAKSHPWNKYTFQPFLCDLYPIYLAGYPVSRASNEYLLCTLSLSNNPSCSYYTSDYVNDSHYSAYLHCLITRIHDNIFFCIFNYEN